MAGGAISSFFPDKPTPVIQPMNSGSYDTKKCPMCAEFIRTDAVICKHCGGKLDAVLSCASEKEHAPLSNAFLQHPDMPGEALETPPITTMKAAFCSQCGTAVIEASLFCCECGHRVCAEA